MYAELIKELISFMELTGKSQKQVAKETTLSNAVISQFLDGRYTGDNKKVAETLTRYLELSEKRKFNISHTKFSESLSNTKEVLFTCQYAHARNDIALVCGDAGAGKTTALEYYKNNSVDVVMITANACTASASAVLKLLCQAVKKNFSGRKDSVMSGLVEYFKDTNRLIIIDEADNLTLSALQAVRNLNDQAKVGIVLSGNDKLYNQMLAGSKSSEFQQIKTRIIVRRKVLNTYTLEEFRDIFPDIEDECRMFLIELAQSESLRTAVKILEITYDLNKSVTIKTLKQVKQELTQGLY